MAKIDVLVIFDSTMRFNRGYFFSTFVTACIFISLTGCKPIYRATSHSHQIYKISASSSDTVSSYLDQFLKPYRDSMDQSLNEVLAVAEGEFLKEKPGGTLGFLIVEALFDEACKTNERIDVVVYNYGGIRLPSIAKGPITLGKVFELLPFDNEMVILEVSKEDWTTWLQRIQEANGWPMYINKKYFSDEAKSYKVATNDYIANGGDQCDFLKKYKYTATGKLIRDIVVDYLKTKGRVAPNSNYLNYSK